MAHDNEILAQYAAPGELFAKLDNAGVRCFACGHRCKILQGRSGTCKVRFNRDGILQVPFGYVSGLQCDPIEKKPFFHVRPGSSALSFGMLGCNFHCGFCQNWVTSQALRDPDSVTHLTPITPERIVKAAKANGSRIVVSTYNEPLITSEWAVAVFKEAKASGMLTAYVSNGCATPEVLEYLLPWVDVFNIDLKSFDEARYRGLGGQLQPVLDTIKILFEKRVWLEIVTLLVPGFNDSRDELQALTEYIRNVSRDIPWHVTAFHKNYRMTDPRNTSSEDLMRAVEIGRDSGLHYIYAGNLPGSTEDMENTRCPKCGELIVERIGFRVLQSRIGAEGTCPSCNTSIAGRWS